MKKADEELIRHAREEMDENIVTRSVFRIQTILEEVYQHGIETGETIGYTKALMELSAPQKTTSKTTSSKAKK